MFKLATEEIYLRAQERLVCLGWRYRAERTLKYWKWLIGIAGASVIGPLIVQLPTSPRSGPLEFIQLLSAGGLLALCAALLTVSTLIMPRAKRVNQDPDDFVIFVGGRYEPADPVLKASLLLTCWIVAGLCLAASFGLALIAIYNGMI